MTTLTRHCGPARSVAVVHATVGTGSVDGLPVCRRAFPEYREYRAFPEYREYRAYRTYRARSVDRSDPERLG